VGLAAVACSNEGTAPATDQAQVIAAESDQLGAMVDTDFGAAGAAATSASTEPAGSGLSAALTTSGADTAPTFWGRLRVVPGAARRDESHLAVPPGRYGEGRSRGDQHDRFGIYTWELRVPPRASRECAEHDLASSADGRQR